jgi:hypothetical protein
MSQPYQHRDTRGHSTHNAVGVPKGQKTAEPRVGEEFQMVCLQDCAGDVMFCRKSESNLER